MFSVNSLERHTKANVKTRAIIWQLQTCNDALSGCIVLYHFRILFSFFLGSVCKLSCFMWEKNVESTKRNQKQNSVEKDQTQKSKEEKL